MPRAGPVVQVFDDEVEAVLAVEDPACFVADLTAGAQEWWLSVGALVDDDVAIGYEHEVVDSVAQLAREDEERGAGWLSRLERVLSRR